MDLPVELKVMKKEKEKEKKKKERKKRQPHLGIKYAKIYFPIVKFHLLICFYFANGKDLELTGSPASHPKEGNLPNYMPMHVPPLRGDLG